MAANARTQKQAMIPGAFQQGVVVLRQHHCFFMRFDWAVSAAKAVQGPALPLQGIHHVKGGDSLAPGMLGVGDCIPDDILQEHLHERLPGVSPVVSMCAVLCDCCHNVLQSR